jgi:integrase
MRRRRSPTSGAPRLAGRRESTIDSYGRYVARYVDGTDVGATPLRGLTPTQLDALYAAMLDRGLSARTVPYLHSIVGKALSDAERKGLVVRNVARQADPPGTRAAAPPEHPVWTPDELRRFLDHVDGHRHGAMLHVAAMTGMRGGGTGGAPRGRR